MGSAPPATPPSTGTGVATFLMGRSQVPLGGGIYSGARLLLACAIASCSTLRSPT
jgi:hypothetical protein